MGSPDHLSNKVERLATSGSVRPRLRTEPRRQVHVRPGHRVIGAAPRPDVPDHHRQCGCRRPPADRAAPLPGSASTATAGFPCASTIPIATFSACAAWSGVCTSAPQRTITSSPTILSTVAATVDHLDHRLDGTR